MEPLSGALTPEPIIKSKKLKQNKKTPLSLKGTKEAKSRSDTKAKSEALTAKSLSRKEKQKTTLNVLPSFSPLCL
ncbi:MAG: hypothetical protein IT281_04175 [Ignavibacteria bacterium]|nr:hypothetical protein [Ignavibacteria bacterium]